jgi:hypothetical protein
MKFNKLYKDYQKLYMEGVIPQEHLSVLQGDQVVFRKGWEKDPQMENLVNSSTGERIREMIEQKEDPLIATAIQSKTPAAYGSHGSQRDNTIANEEGFMVTVSQQYALGLYKNVVVVPMSVLERVDNGNNLNPLSKNQQEQPKRQTTGEEPKLNPNGSDPTVQTHASWKDHGINKL